MRDLVSTFLLTHTARRRARSGLELLYGVRSRDRDPGSTEWSDLGEMGAIAVRFHAG